MSQYYMKDSVANSCKPWQNIKAKIIIFVKIWLQFIMPCHELHGKPLQSRLTVKMFFTLSTNELI